MARPLRIEYPGAWYHVMNRVAGRQRVLDAATHALFLDLLGETCERFSVECHTYCLLDNHYHLLLHTPRAGLGRALRHLNGLFTQRFNRRRHRDGPLFRGRYKAILVEADSYLLALSRYIHRNPFEAGMVKQLDRYPWSSYPAYVGQVPSSGWLITADVLNRVATRSQVARYREYVERNGEDEVTVFYANQRHAPILGSEAFKKLTLRGRRLQTEHAERRRLVRTPPHTEILTAVSREFDVSPAALKHAERGRGRRNLPRAVAMYLCQQRGGLTLTELAKLFNVGHYATVSVTIRRLREDLGGDIQLQKRILRLAGILD